MQDPSSKELDEDSRHQLTGSIPKLHRAAWRGDLERVKFLTDNEQQKLLQKDKYGNTALRGAAKGGNLDILSSGHRLTGSILELHLELHLAARRGEMGIVRFLMDNVHQNPLQKDKYGDTALHAAAQGESLDILTWRCVVLKMWNRVLYIHRPPNRFPSPLQPSNVYCIWSTLSHWVRSE